MATTQDVITRAYRRLRMIGIADDTPPAELSKHALATLNAMMAAWAGSGMSTDDQVLTGDTALDSKVVTGLNDTDNPVNTNALVVGMSVSGTGIAASTRIQSIDTWDQITLDTAATANGSDVSLTFTIFPLDDSLEAALVAVLAVRLSEDFGRTVGPVLARDAAHGEAQLAGAFFRIPATTFDDTIIRIPSGRYYNGTGVIE